MQNDFNAFTLIELITVIVLIGILTAIAMPKFADLQQEAILKKQKSIYDTFRSGLENAMLMKVIQKNRVRNGLLDLDGDGEGDLLYEAGYENYPNGAVYEGGLPVDRIGSSTVTGSACAAIFQKVIQSDLKLVQGGLGSINTCIQQKADICVEEFFISDAYSETYQCHFFFMEDYKPDESIISGFAYYTLKQPGRSNSPVYALFRAPISHLPNPMVENLYYASPQYLFAYEDRSGFLQRKYGDPGSYASP